MSPGNSVNHPSPGRDFIESMLRKKLPRECVIWPFYKNRQGYGALSQNNRYIRATHYVLQRVGRERPSSRHVAAHTCDNPSCVNPRHLVWTTQRDNIQQCVKRQRRADVTGERNPMSSLSAEDVRSIRTSSETGTALAKRYGVSQSTISRIRNKKTWKG